jgi:hypothetical protein
MLGASCGCGERMRTCPLDRVEVAHAGGEGIEAVQRLAEGVQRQRLHVVLDVGPAAARALR